MLMIRNHFLIKLSLSLLVLMVVLSSIVKAIPQSLVMIISIAAVGVMVFAFLNSQRRIKYWIARGQLDIYGETCDFVDDPNPSSSMLSSLRRQGVFGDQISHIKIQTCTFGNGYLESSFLNHLRDAGIFENAKFEIVGSGSKDDAKKLSNLFPNENGQVFESKTNLTQHFNLIQTTSNELFIWFEPVHTESGSEKYPPQEGAFLIRSSNHQLATDRFNGEKARLLS